MNLLAHTMVLNKSLFIGPATFEAIMISPTMLPPKAPNIFPGILLPKEAPIPVVAYLALYLYII